MKAIVTEIQVGGYHTCHSLKDACEEFLEMGKNQDLLFRPKILLAIRLPSGEESTITIRDEEKQTIAYGSLGDLPSFLDYAREPMVDEDNQPTTFEIWSEGFAATGESGPAHFWGEVKGKNFKDACANLAKIHPEFAECYEAERGTYWGCRLFDNEYEARKSFG